MLFYTGMKPGLSEHRMRVFENKVLEIIWNYEGGSGERMERTT